MVVRFVFRFVRLLLFTLALACFLLGLLAIPGGLSSDPSDASLSWPRALLLGFLQAAGWLLFLLGCWTLLVEWSLLRLSVRGLITARILAGALMVAVALPLLLLPDSLALIGVLLRVGAILALGSLGVAVLEPTLSSRQLRRAR